MASTESTKYSALGRLEAALQRNASKKSGGNWQCPAHDDQNPSLSVTDVNGTVLVKCHAGCTPEEVLDSLGLSFRDLFDSPGSEQKMLRVHDTAKTPMREVAHYDYVDRHGEPLSTKIRLEGKSPTGKRAKSFRWHNKNPKVLYNLPLVVEADHVWIHEGEKAADRMQEELPPGHASTCAPTTAWDDSFTLALKGKSVTVVVDRDDSGIRQARLAFEALKSAGVDVRCVQSAVETDKADAFDHFEAGFGLDELVPFDLGESASSGLLASIFTGARLHELTERSPIPPVFPGIPPRGHFTLRVGPSFSGKTTFALWIAMARAAGVAPWHGAPVIHTGRTLIVSPDEPVEQIAKQIRRLASTHPGGRTFDYFAEIAVLGLDSSIPMNALSGLRFHEDGFALLDELVTGGGFDALVIDAYGDMLPVGASEQENETASRVGGSLEALAVSRRIPVDLIHHVGKLGGRTTAEVDVRDLGRGASALAAKARTVFTFEEVNGFANHRRIRTRTNLTRSPAPLDLLVTDRNDASTAIEFFRPVDPATAWPIADVLPDVPSEWISTSELARRLTGKTEGKPTGPAMTTAATVRGIWSAAGLVETRDGPKRATELRRIR